MTDASNHDDPASGATHALWPLIREMLLDLNNEHWGRATPVEKLVQLMSMPLVNEGAHLAQALDWAEAQGLVTRHPGFVSLTETGARRKA